MFLAHFWFIFPVFRENFFFTKIQLLYTTSYGFSSTMSKFRKTKNIIQRKCLDRRMEGQKDGQKDGQALFHRTLPTTTGCPVNNYHYNI